MVRGVLVEVWEIRGYLDDLTAVVPDELVAGNFQDLLHLPLGPAEGLEEIHFGEQLIPAKITRFFRASNSKGAELTVVEVHRPTCSLLLTFHDARARPVFPSESVTGRTVTSTS